MSIWSDDSVELTTEEARRLRYELAHPNPEAMAKRDAFFASFEDKMHISWEPFEMTCEIPGLSRELLESLDRSTVECSMDLGLTPIVEYEMIGHTVTHKMRRMHGSGKRQEYQREFYNSIKENVAWGYSSEKENMYMECKPERETNRCA